MSTGVALGRGPVGALVMVTLGLALVTVSSVGAAAVAVAVGCGGGEGVGAVVGAGDGGAGEVGDRAGGAAVDVGAGGDVPCDGHGVAVEVGEGGSDRQCGAFGGGERCGCGDGGGVVDGRHGDGDRGGFGGVGAVVGGEGERVVAVEVGVGCVGQVRGCARECSVCGLRCDGERHHVGCVGVAARERDCERGVFGCIHTLRHRNRHRILCGGDGQHGGADVAPVAGCVDGACRDGVRAGSEGRRNQCAQRRRRDVEWHCATPPGVGADPPFAADQTRQSRRTTTPSASLPGRPWASPGRASGGERSVQSDPP